MKKSVSKLGRIAFLVCLGGGILTSCNKEDNPGMDEALPTGEKEEYVMAAFNDSGISGIATFEELEDNSTKVTISLDGTMSGGDHPAHIHMNTAAEGGGIVIDLTNVDGDTGISETIISQTNDGDDITYAALIEFDGYINVHNSPTDLGTFLTQGDIGQNALTGEMEEYIINAIGESGISGAALFAERKNGETLITIDVTGDATESDHPTHIHTGSSSSPGGIAIDLNNVKNGSSKTNISAFNDDTPVTYDELINYAGYINIHNTPGDFSVVAQGNIGTSVGEETSAANYEVSSPDNSAYSFSGNGLTDSSNPDLTLTRGQTYTFTVDSPGHPFWIKSVQGSGQSNAYNSGVTNNGSVNATITFEVPMDAPETLFYNCEFHSVMTGTITIID